MNNSLIKSLNTKAVRIGGYTTVITAVVILIAVAVNLLFGQLPETYTKFDTSGLNMYTLTETTEKLISAIDEKVTIYLVAQNGSEDGTLSEILGRYSALSRNITVKNIDPVQKPNFTSQYTEDSLPANSLIIESDRRNTVVSYDKIYYYQLYYQDTYIGDCSESELQSAMYTFYSYYGQTPTTVPVMDAEGALTSAINYVTSASIPKLYMISGHGESALDTIYQDYLSTDNIDVSDGYQLLTSGKIPDDAQCVMINLPTSDITEAECDMLKEYIAGGGNLMMITYYQNYSTSKMPNISALMEYYGMAGEDGMIIEGNSNKHYPNYPYYLLPGITASDATSALESTDIYVMMANAHGIKAAASTREGVALYPILTTSSLSYIKLNPESSTTKESGDKEGPFYVGAAAVEGNSKVVWYSSPTIALSAYDVSGGNSKLFMSSVNWLCENETESISIATRELQVEALVIPELQANIWTVVISVLIPSAVLIYGVIVFVKRRKN